MSGQRGIVGNKFGVVWVGILENWESLLVSGQELRGSWRGWKG